MSASFPKPMQPLGGHSVPQPILTLEGIQKRRATELFSPVSFTLNPGEGLGVYGFNGSGKTTLLDIISGLEKASAGQLVLTGSVGYAMQHAGFQEALSLKDNLLLEAHLCGFAGSEARGRAQKLAARLDILPFWNTRYGKASSGMKGRLAIAAALIASPQLLLLDEAYNFLDQHSVEQTFHVLRAEKERGAALVMVSHAYEDFAGLCERVLLLPTAELTIGTQAP
ncbi:MAG: ATP-binding cassette domain-containing protein [Coriobacteriales bacterium]|nr:ATP-binding cassette domain-containing protein [Coriobacteriales bacterium]